MINKALSAAITIAFLMAVKPEPAPSAFGFAITAVLMYEGLQYAIGYCRQANKKRKDKHYITLTKQDMKRWANTRLYWPMEEVR